MTHTTNPSTAQIRRPNTEQALPVSQRTDLLNLTRQELQEWCSQHKQPAYRAKQLYQWLYQHFETDFAQMTNLPKAFRAILETHATVGTLRTQQVLRSQDGTIKLLFLLHDNRRIEAVLIPEDKRMTLCVSSQVGCALGCKFCYTASMGPGRNLTLGEYVAQLIEASRILPKDRRVTNVVFMGMGEPLINFDNLLKTIDTLTDEEGLHLGKRRITVSTAGLCPQIIELGRRSPVRLAISLHATTNETRDALMPINQRYDLETLFGALHQYRELMSSYRLSITLEYTLIEGVNDRDEDAKRLIKRARSIDAKINLIPYNEHPGAPYKRPSRNRIMRFRKLVEASNLRVTCRVTRGDDIYAACGQLAIHAPKQLVTKRPT